MLKAYKKKIAEEVEKKAEALNKSAAGVKVRVKDYNEGSS